MTRSILIALLLLTGCTTAAPAMFRTPKEHVTQCQEICGGVGMDFSAMVVIMNSAGCVCEVHKQGSAPVSEGASAASGGAVIAAAAAAQAASQQQTQQTMFHH